MSLVTYRGRPITLWIALTLASTWFGILRVAASDDKNVDDGIQVGQPKIWRYERIYPLLDGMLRDIESTSLQSMNPMNPNEANLQYVDFLRSLIDVQVNYNQGIGVNNQLELWRVKRQQAQQKSQDDYLSTLNERRIAQSQQLNQAEAAQFAARQKVNSLDPNSPEGKAAQQHLTDINSQVASLQTSLKDTSTEISQVSQQSSAVGSFKDANTPDTSKNTSAQAPQFLDQVPDDVKKALLSKMGTADLPASKQLENYLTLLNERLSKQLSVIEDDASRNGYELYLMQFDVGLYAFKKTKNQIARVEFNFGPEGCDPRAQAYAYSLIPGSSAYNIEEYIGKSQHIGVIGAFNLLMGLGANGSYQRQRDQLHNGLVQSVYESGFTNGICSFGWYYGPSPFENFVSPGVRSTYALVAVRKDASLKELKIRVDAGWETTKGVIRRVGNSLNDNLVYTVPLPELENRPIRANSMQTLSVRRLAYHTAPLAQKSAPADPANDKIPHATNTVLIVLDEPADPDLMVTVAGTLLKRTRDTRGQAIRNLTSAPPRGEFEVDGFGPNSWILANPTTLLLQISQDVAGDEFPLIRLTDSSSPGEEVLNLLDKDAEIDVNNFRFTELPPTRWAFAPLFSSPQPIDDYLKVSVEERMTRGDQSDQATKIRVRYTPYDPSYPKLNDTAEVVLDATVNPSKPLQWALKCVGKDRDLICETPKDACKGAGISCESFPSDARIYVRNKLQPLSNGSSSIPLSPTDVQGSAVFDSGEVLPYVDVLDPNYSVDFKDGNWIISLNGTHLSLINEAQDFIPELGDCPAVFNIVRDRGTVSLHATSDSQLLIAVPAKNISAICSRDFGPSYHLKHLVAPNRFSGGLKTPISSSPRSVSIDLPNLFYLISARFTDLQITNNGDDSYSISGPYLLAQSVSGLKVSGEPLMQVKAESTKVVKFTITPEMKKKNSSHTISLAVGPSTSAAYFDAVASDKSLLCINFYKGDKTGCIGGPSPDVVIQASVEAVAGNRISTPAKTSKSGQSNPTSQAQPDKSKTSASEPNDGGSSTAKTPSIKNSGVGAATGADKNSKPATPPKPVTALPATSPDKNTGNKPKGVTPPKTENRRNQNHSKSSPTNSTSKENAANPKPQ
jgi:hypothetical protein